jgi:hypothetical protein
MLITQLVPSTRTMYVKTIFVGALVLMLVPIIMLCCVMLRSKLPVPVFGTYLA